MTDHPPFPSWVKELLYVGGFIVALTIFGQTLKSDQRSTREEMSRMSQDVLSTKNDVNAIRALLPNREVLDLRLKGIDDRIQTLRGDFEFEKARTQKLREDLIRKGMVD